MKLYVTGHADEAAPDPPVEALRMIIAARKTLNPEDDTDFSLSDANALLLAATAEPQFVGESDTEDQIIECETALGQVGVLTERDWNRDDAEAQEIEAAGEAAVSDGATSPGPSYTACQLAMLTLKQTAGNPLNAYALLLEQRKLVGSALAPVNGEAAMILADTFDITSP